ncbi:MAG: response regulator [Thermoproteota archaeon]|nr:response regulator [Thermoproteota archaeon]
MEDTNVAPTDKKIVSIVDDEVDIAVIFQDTLSTRMEGTSLVSFNDPAIALDHYKKNIYDYALVIADFRMPNKDGMEFLKRVKKLDPNAKEIRLRLVLR